MHAIIQSNHPIVVSVSQNLCDTLQSVEWLESNVVCTPVFLETQEGY